MGDLEGVKVKVGDRTVIIEDMRLLTRGKPGNLGEGTRLPGASTGGGSTGGGGAVYTRDETAFLRFVDLWKARHNDNAWPTMVQTMLLTRAWDASQ